MLGKIFQGIGVAVVTSGVLHAISKALAEHQESPLKQVVDQSATWFEHKEQFLHDLAYYQDLSEKGYVIAGRFADELNGGGYSDKTLLIDPDRRLIIDGVDTGKLIEDFEDSNEWICGVCCLKPKYNYLVS